MSMLMTIGLALVLSLDSYVVAAGCSSPKKILYSHGVMLSLCFSVFHAMFLVCGYLVGQALGTGQVLYDLWVAAALLAFVGAKIMLRSARKRKNVNVTFVTGSKSILLFAFATSIDFLIVGMGLGFMHLGNSIIWWCAGLLAFFTIVSTFFGVLMGRQRQRESRRIASILEGVAIVALALHILL